MSTKEDTREFLIYDLPGGKRGVVEKVHYNSVTDLEKSNQYKPGC